MSPGTFLLGTFLLLTGLSVLGIAAISDTILGLLALVSGILILIDSIRPIRLFNRP